jgi:hypothetical protein
MYRWFGVVSQCLDVLFPFVLFGDFRSLLLEIFLERFRSISLWDLVGVYAWTLHGSFLFDSPLKFVSKGARFWGFRCSRVRGVLGGIFLDSSWFSKFWWTKSWLWGTQEVLLLSPKSCTNPWSNSGDRKLDLGELTRGCCSSQELRSHRSDRCLSPVWPVQTPVEFCSGEHLGEFAVVLCCYYFVFGSVWSLVGMFGRFGVCWLELVWPVSYTGLTGVGAFLWKFLGFTSRDRSDRWCSPAWPV